MNHSFSFDDLEFFTVGTLGPLGERVFYLQCRSNGVLLSLRLEKQQVAALAEYLDQVIHDLPVGELGPLPDDLGLREPVVSEWTVGSLGVAYQSDNDRLIVMAEELLDDDADDGVDPAQARFALRREQVIGLIDRARTLVAAGRPPCPICRRPLHPRHDGWCPCSN